MIAKVLGARLDKFIMIDIQAEKQVGCGGYPSSSLPATQANLGQVCEGFYASQRGQRPTACAHVFVLQQISIRLRKHWLRGNAGTRCSAKLVSIISDNFGLGHISALVVMNLAASFLLLVDPLFL